MPDGPSIIEKKPLSASLRVLLTKPVLSMLFLGFSAGLPLLLIFSSLSLWLREAGVERSTVTYFSWAALAYSFKFLWAPLVDRLPLPVLTSRLGRRRGWLLLSQLSIITAVLLIASVDPAVEGQITLMALAVVLLGFSSATQDIVIDAFRIESASQKLQGLMSSTYIAGYRIGMLVSGAGGLLLASTFGSSQDAYSYEAWKYTYQIMALTFLVGVVTTLAVDEPKLTQPLNSHHTNLQYVRFLMLFFVSALLFIGCYGWTSDWAATVKASFAGFTQNKALAGFLVESIRLTGGVLLVIVFIRLVAWTPLYERQLITETYVAPVADFFGRYGIKAAVFLLVFIGFFRISDIVLGVISNVFFQDMGFTKVEIATVVKTFGLFMTIAGGFLGGIFALRFGVIRSLYLGASLTVATNLLFMVLAQQGHDLLLLYVVISADNLSAGFASAAFVAFLSGLTSISFTAVQYAIFSSLMTLLPKIIGGYSGSMVENMGYMNFFFLASLMGLPVLLLIYFVSRYTHFEVAEK